MKVMLERFLRKIPNSDGILVWQCKACNLIKKNKSHVVEHIEASHITGLHFKCPYCPQMLNSRTSVRTHVHSKHKTEHLMYKMDMANIEWIIEDTENPML